MGSNLSYLSEYQSFQDKAELNNHVSQHIDATYEDINATDRSIFKLIARYAVKYAGASHLKVATIAEAIGKTDRTVRTVLAKLEKLGMVQRIKRNRIKSGGRGANIIVILPFIVEPTSVQTSEPTSYRTDDEKADAPTEEPSKFDKEALRKLDLKNNKDYVLDTVLESPKAVKNNIPAVIYNVLNPFFNGKDLRKMTGIIFRAKTHEIRIEDFSTEFETVILDVIRRYKECTISNLEGYLYKSIRKLSRHLQATSRLELFGEILDEMAESV